MKKILGIIFVLFILLSCNSFVYAQSPAASSSGSLLLTRIQTQANKEIQRRVTSLQNLIMRLGLIKKLNQSQKDKLIANANDQVTKLNALASKIASDTDVAEAREDRKSIFSQYRIYMLFIPQTRIILAADRVTEVAELLEQVQIPLTSRVAQLKAEGKDTKALDDALTGAAAKLTDAKTQATNAIKTVEGLTPDQGDDVAKMANKTALESARSMIKTAITDLTSARKDFQTVRRGLKK
jgi:hypothetical protein